MIPTQKSARVAGALYLLLGIFGPFSLMYVPRTLIVPGNAVATAARIRASEMLFRAGIAAELLGTVAFIAVAVALYRLLAGVSQLQAGLMAVLALLSVPISFAGGASELVALALVRGGDYLAVFTRPQLDALAYLFLRLHSQGIVVNEIFWGLWLLPFGVLVYRSGFLPRILGVLLLINGAAYVAVTLTTLLAPNAATVLNRYVFIAELGELWVMFWLLIRGVRVPPAAAPAVPA